MKIKSEVIKRSITHKQHMREVLKDTEYQKDYLRLSIQEYAKDGDYTMFFKSLERVIKFAQEIDLNRSNLCNILKGKVQPSFDTTMKILRGLGADIEVKFA